MWRCGRRQAASTHPDGLKCRPSIPISNPNHTQNKRENTAHRTASASPSLDTSSRTAAQLVAKCDDGSQQHKNIACLVGGIGTKELAAPSLAGMPGAASSDGEEEPPPPPEKRMRLTNGIHDDGASRKPMALAYGAATAAASATPAPRFCTQCGVGWTAPTAMFCASCGYKREH